MKKFLAVILTMILLHSVSITASAEESTGSITITNATIGETYTAYKIFDASVKLATGGDSAEAVSYSIETNNQFFDDLFGADGTADNVFFTYRANTGSVEKNKGVNDSELITYLTKLVEDGNFTPSATPIVASSKVVKFEDLPYGYYLVTSSLGTVVTINSNTPSVEVIDKNQEPVPDFDKQVKVGEDKDGNPIWGDSNSAGIGEEITYKISFTSTNYDGDKKIKYYQVHDEKGEAIWAEFNSFKVVVDGVELKRGYYLSQGGINTDNWEYLGDWSAIAENDRDRNDAEWYLVHLGYDKFRITIPWLENHTLNEVKDDSGNVVSYSLTFADDAACKFNSPAEVVITYRSVVEAGAAIGGTTHGNRFNKAYASWISDHETGSNVPDEVVTHVYGIGLVKADSATGKNLAGAKFRIYSDKECTKPVYVIPTDVEGVYIVDSKGTASETISGLHKETTRSKYAAYLADYLGTNEQDNYVVSQVNGKLAILGLKEGSYFLKEVEPPAGYNALTVPVEIKAGSATRPFVIYADANGKVADIQAEDGVYFEQTLDLTHMVVLNSKGEALPATGGAGTFWLITIGSLLAIAFAVFLITHKKMSVYKD